MPAFTFYKQLNAKDCGPTCLRMIARHYGKNYSAEMLRRMTGFNKTGVSLSAISHTAEQIGFRTRGVKITFDQLQEIPLPAILFWDQRHFVVITKANKRSVIIADPSTEILSYSKDEFLSHWAGGKTADGLRYGLALLMEPTPVFYGSINGKGQKITWRLAFKYLRKSRFQVGQVFVSLVLTSVLQLFIPFLTQNVVDKGIALQNLNFVVVLLSAQVMVIFSQTIVGLLRSRLLLRISNLLNLQILSDFWIKLTRLPLGYFDAHHTGDTMQRINDHGTIQNFITGTALNTLFSVLTFVVYAVALMTYSVSLFVAFIIGSIFYFGWIQLFLKLRRKINYEMFSLASKENSTTLQLVQGMQEIRLNNAEKRMRWGWENIQAALFKLTFRSLNYNQIQSVGATVINQLQNVVISYLVAKLVIDGRITMGAMLATQYIIGQLSGPIGQWVGFVQSAQDARISMERLNEIHEMADEEDGEKIYVQELPEKGKSISISGLSFTYPGSGNVAVLHEINLFIPQGKVLAIVGTSGSGKTTLLKILLKIYERYEGQIRVGEVSSARSVNGIMFDDIGHTFWRQQCGAVMQDGFIFNDSISRNIVVGQDEIDQLNLVRACQIANIYPFIQSLPNGFETQLGTEGVGLSQGQKQRLLIARAVYKNPDYLFFDEATNALDANTEKGIVENLSSFFNGRTVVVVAHRLSTVKNADKIVVMENGRIVEEGTHVSLSRLKGKYFELVKNQLEMEGA